MKLIFILLITIFYLPYSILNATPKVKNIIKEVENEGPATMMILGFLDGLKTGMKDGALLQSYSMMDAFKESGIFNKTISSDDFLIFSAKAGICNDFFEMTPEDVVAFAKKRMDLQEYRINELMILMTEEQVEVNKEGLESCFLYYKMLWSLE